MRNKLCKQNLSIVIFLLGFLVVRTVDVLGTEAILMWKLSWCESSVNLVTEDKGEHSALSLETSSAH